MVYLIRLENKLSVNDVEAYQKALWKVVRAPLGTIENSKALYDAYQYFCKFDAIINTEVSVLWERYQDANYIGIKFDQSLAMLNDNLEEIYEVAGNFYDEDEPAIDYILQRRWPVLIKFK